MPDSPLPPRLTELLDMLSKTPALIKEEVRALQQAPVSRTSTDDVLQAEGRLTELRQHIEQAKADLAAMEAKHASVVEDMSRWEEAVGNASRQHGEISAQVAAAQLELQRAEEALRQIALHRAHYEELVAQADRVHIQINEREHSLAIREHAIAAREQTVEQRSERLEATRYWLEHLLPEWLIEEDIVGWRDALMDDAQHPRVASNTAGLLFATLSLYTYALRETDARAIADALRDVGRRLFSWLKERDVGDYEASSVAQAWAERINRECFGRCEIEVPVPGAPAQNQTMLYQPRPGVSAQSVASVQSWCVRGSKREVIHRATIAV